MKKFVCFGILLILWGIPGFSTTYTLTDLGDFGGVSSFASGINDAGHVVGYADSDGISRAFYTDGIDMDCLKSPGPSQAVDLNDKETIVGTFFPLHKDAQIACLWKKGHLQPLRSLGGTFGFALAINNYDQVVGYSSIRLGSWSWAKPCLWQKGKITSLAEGIGWAFDLNNLTQIVGSVDFGYGQEAFIWQDGIISLLGPGYAYGINDLGQVVGFYSLGEIIVPFTIIGNQTMILPSLGDSALALKINNRAQIVGYSQTKAGDRAVIWENGQVVDLNLLVSSPDWILFAALDINNSGQICCRGYNLKTHQTHAVLLSPN